MNPKLIIVLAFLIYLSPLFYHSYLAFKAYKKDNKRPLQRLKKFFKYTCILLAVLVGIFATLNHTNFLNYERPMTYDKYDTITFENFRGLEFFQKSLYGIERFAYVVTTIETDIEEDSVSIASYFHPSRSYVYNTHSSSTELLTHEKYHIKITELYARKIKAKLVTLRKPSEKEIQDVVDEMLEAEQAYQQKYDYDTFHSYVLSEQKRYQNEVDSLLGILTEFKHPKIKLND
ncbi:DUF922 domain-containing protein [Kordia sp.]|uniref:DUF922 domain-containing protein n=1 Tax=Kordia sp. TaxID=1965332 RepID=UPI003B5B275E